MSTEREPNTKYAPVPMPVPREPGEYEPTTHFGQRLRDRVPKPLRDRVIRECIEQGYCRGSSPPDSLDSDSGIVQAFAFDHTVEGVQWTVVVGIRREAYELEEAKHLAITVYPEENDRTD